MSFQVDPNLSYVGIGRIMDPVSPRVGCRLWAAFNDAGAMTYDEAQELVVQLRTAEGVSVDAPPAGQRQSEPIVRLPSFSEMRQIMAAAARKKIGEINLRSSYWVANRDPQSRPGYIDTVTGQLGFDTDPGSVRRVHLVR